MRELKDIKGINLSNLDQEYQHILLKMRSIAIKVLLKNEIRIKSENLDFINDEENSWYSYVVCVQATAETTFQLNDQFIDIITTDDSNLDKSNIVFRFKSGGT